MDVVNCMEMLEHVPIPALWFMRFAPIQKPDGWVFFHHAPQCCLMLANRGEYVLMLARGTHEYAKMIRPSELWALPCRRPGCCCTKATVQPNTITRRLVQCHTSVEHLLAARKSPGRYMAPFSWRPQSCLTSMELDRQRPDLGAADKMNVPRLAFSISHLPDTALMAGAGAHIAEALAWGPSTLILP